MEKFSDEDHTKLSTMKLSIVYFTSKLENYMTETNVTYGDMLKLMSRLTNCIDLFVSSAKVVKTNHSIESEIDKNNLTCENVFECRLCSEQTGKTYNSLINHIRNKKHIAHVKNSKQKTKAIKPKPVDKRSIDSSVNSVPVIPVSISMDSMLNSNRPKELKDFHSTVQNALAIAPLASLNNNISSIKGFMNNVTCSPSSIKVFMNNVTCLPDHSGNYKELFKMPSPHSVIGFQQNIVNPSNNFVRNERTRNRKKRKTRDVDDQLLPNDLTLLNRKTMSFLKGNFEIEVKYFMAAAQALSNNDLYACIANNLIKCCQQMHSNVEVGYFGSRVINIGTEKSDIDVNITVTDSSKIDENFLQNLQNILQKDSNWSNAIYIKSRVPLVRAHNIEMNIDCDVTFNNDLAMTNTEFVKYCYTIQPEFKGYLPKVMDLIDASTTDNFWPNKFHCKSLSELNIEMVTDFKATCLDFIDFYAHRVNFNTDVLSALPKELFGTGVFFKQNDCYHGLNQHMAEYPRAAASIKINFSMAMCVQDPFAHDHNVTRCIGKSNLKRFKDYCHETHKILKGNISKAIHNNDYDDDYDDDDD